MCVAGGGDTDGVTTAGLMTAGLETAWLVAGGADADVATAESGGWLLEAGDSLLEAAG